MWTYNQANGSLSKDGTPFATGYSGAGAGKDTPALEAIANVGPIPRGPLHYPCEGTATHGRDGFLVHADSRTSRAS